MAETSPLAPRPHPDAAFDWERRSNYGPAPLDGWVFWWACPTYPRECQAFGYSEARLGPDFDTGPCPDCGGPVRRLRAGEVADDWGHHDALREAHGTEGTADG